jgi:hypothetical protein
MAAEGEVPERVLRAHRSGYDGFVSLMKWGAVVSFIVALIVIAIISS